MQKRCIAVCHSVLLVMFGALAQYGDCSDNTNHNDFGGENESPAIHCLNVFFLSSETKASTTIQSQRNNLSYISPSIADKIGRFVVGNRFEDHLFWGPFSQQDLFRFEEVYRL